MASSQFNDTFDIWPFNPSRWKIFMKWLLGLIIGILISFIVFIMLILVWWIVNEAIATSLLWTTQVNPLLPLILVIIAFLWTFLWSITMAFTYNMLYPEKYYDMSKMFSLIFFANIIAFVFFMWLYLLFAWGINELFFVLALHIMFTVFLTFSLIEISSNPNYAAVHILWAAIGLIIAIVIFGIVYKMIDVTVWSSAHIMLALPPVIIYASLPFWHWLREKIYYKLYSNWANFFYIPSLSEVLVDEAESEEVQVEVDIDM